LIRKRRNKLTLSNDPFAYIPRFPDGSLRGGIYHRIRIHLMQDALALGWIPVPPRQSGHCDEYVVWATWITCACGREMRLPL
jgi:hypothetical protein